MLVDRCLEELHMVATRRYGYPCDMRISTRQLSRPGPLHGGSHLFWETIDESREVMRYEASATGTVTRKVYKKI